MIRFGRWTEQERAYAVAHLESLPPPNAFICKKDRSLPAFHGHAGNISVNYSVYGYVESNGRH